MLIDKQTQGIIRDELTSIIEDRGESILNDDGVDKGVSLEIAHDCLEKTMRILFERGYFIIEGLEGELAQLYLKCTKCKTIYNFKEYRRRKKCEECARLARWVSKSREARRVMYLAYDGTYCYFCGSPNINAGHMEIDSAAWCEVECDDCKKAFRDVYKLVNVEADYDDRSANPSL